MAKHLPISDKGIDFIARYEGFSPIVYKDSAGYLTIGFGHKLQPGQFYPLGISREEAVKLLKEDARYALQGVQRYTCVGLSQCQSDALLSFAFNIGTASYRSSTLLRLLNAGEYQGAAEEFLRWNKVTVNGVLAANKGLTRRRYAERELFLYGRYG